MLLLSFLSLSLLLMFPVNKFHLFDGRIFKLGDQSGKILHFQRIREMFSANVVRIILCYSHKFFFLCAFFMKCSAAANACMVVNVSVLGVDSVAFFAVVGRASEIGRELGCVSYSLSAVICKFALEFSRIKAFQMVEPAAFMAITAFQKSIGVFAKLKLCFYVFFWLLLLLVHPLLQAY